ncbi:ester cyclase [soil metagenome]
MIRSAAKGGTIAYDLAERYAGYIACLNRQDWAGLPQFVAEDVCYNEERIGLSGYRAMLQGNYRDIPDLRFDVALLVHDQLRVASRLQFDCTPVADFLGLQVNGRRISFAENVIYQFAAGKIEAVWSIVDKAAIEAQLRR